MLPVKVQFVINDDSVINKADIKKTKVYELSQDFCKYVCNLEYFNQLSSSCAIEDKLKKTNTHTSQLCLYKSD